MTSLLDALWPETYVQPQVLRTYMLELRKVLGDDIGSPRFIQTVPKRGYTLCCAGHGKRRGEERGCSHSGDAPRPTPHRMRNFIDRDEEMGRLQAALHAAAAGQRQLICVAGGAGIGKTALVDAFLRYNDSAAITVARGQSVEALGRKEEYYPVMEALAHLCASPDGERACRVLARIAPGWLPAGTRGSRPTRIPRPAIRSVRMPGELCAALEELAAEKPLISGVGRSALGRRFHPGRHLGAGPAPHAGQADGAGDVPRPGWFRGPGPEIAQAGPGDSPAVRRTEPWSARSRTRCAKLLSRELGQESLPPGLEEFIYDRSEGNPLFVKAMLEHLIAERYLVREPAGTAGAWRQRAPFPAVESGVPNELSQMIELEIERLGADDQRLLEAASLMNVAFPAWAVAAAVEGDAGEIEEACDDLARRLYFVRRAGEDELPDGTRSAILCLCPRALSRSPLPAAVRLAPRAPAYAHCRAAGAVVRGTRSERGAGNGDALRSRGQLAARRRAC